MNPARIVVVLALAVAFSASAIIRQQPATAASPVAYIALGDSIAYGIGSSLPERRGYPPLVRGILADYTGDAVELHNLAVPGETAATFLSDGQADALAGVRRQLDEQGISISLVTISLGGNEMLAERYSGGIDRQQALAAFTDALDAAVTRVRDETGPETTIVLTTYYDLSEGDATVESTDAWWIVRFNQVIIDTAQRHNALVADLEPAFRGEIDVMTLHPYDVHPKNQGYRAIASQVWTAVALDRQPPEITVVSPAEVNRRAPTLQVDVTDDSEVALVTVAVNGNQPVEPLAVGGGRYVLLVDLRDDLRNEVSITIRAVDIAGNSSRSDTQIVITGR